MTISHTKNTGTSKQYKQNYSVDSLTISIPIGLVMMSLIFAGLSATTLLPWAEFISNRSSVFKFITIFPLFLAVVISIMTLSPGRFVYKFLQTLKINIFLTSFIALSIPGAVLASLLYDQPSSYFTQSFILLSFLMASFIFFWIPNRIWGQVQRWLVLAYGIISLLSVLDVSRNILLGLRKSEPNTIFILLMAFVLSFYKLSKLLRILMLLLLSVYIFLTFKNTAILAYIAICICFYIFPKHSLRKITIGNIIGFSLAILLALLVAVLGYWLLQTQFAGFSDGNTTFRTIIYEYRLRQFLSSPIIGQLFTGETAYEFVYLFNGITAPTHSDWLDILAQGGLVGIALFSSAIFYVGYSMVKTRRRSVNKDRKSFEVSSWVLVLLVPFSVMSLFNSILNTPNVSLIFWVALAIGHRTAKYNQVINS